MDSQNQTESLISRTHPEITIIKETDQIIRDDIKKLWEPRVIEQDFIKLRVPKYRNSKEFLNLFTYRYVNPYSNYPKAVVIQFHGYLGHNTTCDFLAKALGDNDLIFLGYDHRGHGKSEGKLNCFESVDILVDDAKIFISEVKKIYPDLPLFIGGVSLGGLVAYLLSLESPKEFKGVYLMAPAIKTGLSCFLENLTGCLGCCCPCGRLPRVDNLHTIFGNAEARDYVRKDPYYPIRVQNFKTLAQMLKKMKSCEPTFKNYNAHFIIFMGGNDKVIKPDCAFSLIKQSPSKDKELVYYETMYHSVLLEDEFFDVVDKLIKFIKRKLSEC